MSKATLNFESNTFEKAKRIVQEEYNRITLKSSGRVVVSSQRNGDDNVKLIIKSK